MISTVKKNEAELDGIWWKGGAPFSDGKIGEGHFEEIIYQSQPKVTAGVKAEAGNTLIKQKGLEWPNGRV